MLITSSAAATEALIQACRIEATALLNEHRHVVEAVAKELIVRRRLDGGEIDSIEDAVAKKSLADEQARRTAWAETTASAAAFNNEPC